MTWTQRIIVLALAATASILVVSAMGTTASAPTVRDGVLDLRQWEGSRRVTLRGEWEVWWDALLSPARLPAARSAATFPLPGVWNQAARPDGRPRGGFGTATFRLRVLLPERDATWALKVGSIKSAAVLWINGALAHASGKVADTAGDEVPRPAHFLVPLPPSREVELVLAVSNHFHHEGGVQDGIVLGALDDLTRERARSDTLAGAALWGPLVLAAFVGALSLGDRSRWGGLLFAGLALVVALRQACLSRDILDLWPGIEWSLVYRLEYLSIYLFPTLYGHLLRNLFPDDIPRRVGLVLNAFAVVGIAVQFGTPVHVFTSFRDGATLMVLVSVLAFFGFIVLAWVRGRPGAALVTVGVTLVGLAVANDFLLYAHRIRSVDLAQLGIVGFLLTNGLVLGRRAIAASRALALLNLRLEREVAERTRDLSEATDRATRQAEARANLLAVLSHEIRTPLNGMLGLLRAMARDDMPAAQERRLGTVLRSGGELVALLTDVLDAARAEVDRLPLRIVPFDPARLVHEVADLARGAAGEKGLTVETALAAGLPARVRGDLARIRQILLNLVSNAIKYSVAGTVVLSAEWDGEGLHLTVTDSGVGLSDAELAQLFAAFTRHAESDDGTGLGLYICQRLARAMGARLTASSAIGSGSRFRLSVPVDVVPDAEIGPVAHPAPIPAGRAGRRLTILVVDDVALNRTVLVDILDLMGHRCREAATGTAALAAVEGAADLDLVLLDIRLPDIDGVEVARRIRAGTRGPRLPIVAVTANAFDQDVERYRREGFLDVLVKPVTEEALADCLVLAAGADAVPGGTPVIQPARRRHLHGLLLAVLQETGADIRQGGDRADWPRVAAAAHKLAGAAANFGHGDLAEAARELETAALAGGGADATPVLALIARVSAYCGSDPTPSL